MELNKDGIEYLSISSSALATCGIELPIMQKMICLSFVVVNQIFIVI
jgi:hypothetical protein